MESTEGRPMIEDGKGVPLDDPVQTYLHEIGEWPLLSEEDEVTLSKAIIRGDKRAPRHAVDKKTYRSCRLCDTPEHAFANHNLRLVVNVAKKYANPSVSLLDRIEEGNIGLIHALPHAKTVDGMRILTSGFDYERGNRFSTYATWWIRQAISKSLGGGDTIRHPQHVREYAHLVRQVSTHLSQELMGEPTTAQIRAGLIDHLRESYVKARADEHFAQHLTYPSDAQFASFEPTEAQLLTYAKGRSIGLEDYEIESTATLPSTVSLDVSVDGDGNELLNLVQAEAVEAPRATKEDVDRIFGPLMRTRANGQLIYPNAPQMIAILRLRTGIDDDGTARTLLETSWEFSTSRERIRQLEDEAKKKLGRYEEYIREMIGEG